jgi:hypothetical protein
MNTQPTIVVVLRSGGDFAFRDVELISRHINMKWEAIERPRIICLSDKASQEYDLGNLQVIPLKNELPGTWSRMALYSPEMEKYRPFLYVDLDTAIIESIENIFELVRDPSMFITLEDFYQKGQLATGLVWVPANSDKIKKIWKSFNKEGVTGNRMDYFLRKVVKPDLFWQAIQNNGIVDFKPQNAKVVTNIEPGMNLICFHGKPRIFQAVESSMSIDWINNYVNQYIADNRAKATVIISYKEDRGWLKDAIDSIPSDVQLILSQGNNSWSEDFNRALPKVRGKYIKYLHEDDMLTENSIEESIKAIEGLGVDFIHGDVIELHQNTGRQLLWRPPIAVPTLKDLLFKNTMHSASMFYRREVFEKLGGFDPDLNTSEDYEFNLKCLANGMKLGYCSTGPLAIYRRHGSQKVRTTQVKIQNEKRNMIRKRYMK